MPITFMWIFLGSMLIGVPILFAMIFAPLLGFVLADKLVFLKIIPQRLFFGINQFPLLAIPLFILAGEIMNIGGITQRLIRFSNALVGHLRGGLAQVNIVSCIFFSGLSGSAVADASAIGSVLIPAMEKEGYSRRFAAAVTTAASVLGPIIPPSIIMIVYAFIMQVSVAGLFLAGFVPGLLIGFGLMVVAWLISSRRNYPKKDQRVPLAELGASFRGAILPLLTPVILLGGIVSGVFTPTEAAGAAVFYAFVLSAFVLRTLPWREVPDMLFRSGLVAASILLIIGAATVFGWIASLSGFSNWLAGALFSISQDPLLLLFFVNILLFITGMFFDAGPAILILGPVLAPTMTQLGIEPLHFAIIMCVNLTIGLATPPVGLLLFVTSSLTKLSVEAIAREMLPFYIVHVVVIFLITYIPALTMAVPHAFGFR